MPNQFTQVSELQLARLMSGIVVNRFFRVFIELQLSKPDLITKVCGGANALVLYAGKYI